MNDMNASETCLKENHLITKLTSEEFTNARDNLMLRLTIRNIKRAGDVPHLKLRLMSPLLCPKVRTSSTLRWQNIRLRCRESRHKLW